MQRNFLQFSLTLLFFILIGFSCTKIDSTTLGADLIPSVDNINTFEAILPIDGTQGIFDDTTKLARNEYHIVGSIDNDPVFGKTKADVYLELKPSFYPFTFVSKEDTIDVTGIPGTGFDSAVLCLSVNSFYGDTMQPQKLSVYQMNNNTSNFRYDTSYQINYQPDVQPDQLLGQATITPAQLKDSILIDTTTKEKTAFQIRIKLSTDFLNTLVAQRDTSAAAETAFRSDSIFKRRVKGFAIVSDQVPGGNGLFYISLSDPKTRLEIFFRKKNKTLIQTGYTSFRFSTGVSVAPGAHANSIKRDRISNSPEYPNSPQPDALYIQSVPGTYAILNVPGLATFENSIIHRAEIIAEQIPGNPQIDNALPAPPFLYLDLKDTGSVNRYKTIYTDLNPSVSYLPDNNLFFYPSGGIDLRYFGGYRTMQSHLSGNKIATYNFNVSRYVQSLVTKRGVNYQFRLYAPYNLAYFDRVFAYPNSTQSLANGRVKIGNGNNSNSKLRMRIVYSKIQ